MPKPTRLQADQKKLERLRLMARDDLLRSEHFQTSAAVRLQQAAEYGPIRAGDYVQWENWRGAHSHGIVQEVTAHLTESHHDLRYNYRVQVMNKKGKLLHKFVRLESHIDKPRVAKLNP